MAMNGQVFSHSKVGKGTKESAQVHAELSKTPGPKEGYISVFYQCQQVKLGSKTSVYLSSCCGVQRRVSCVRMNGTGNALSYLLCSSQYIKL